MFSTEKSRRSFFVELMTKAAGLCVAFTGAAALSSCGEETTKYGGIPGDYGTGDRLLTKYGGPADLGGRDMSKYGGPAYDRGSDSPAMKYGGFDSGPTTKYGGFDTGPTTKYGGFDGGAKLEGGIAKPG